MRGILPGAGHIDIRAVDLAVGAWIVAWVVVATVAFVEVRDLEQLSDTLARSGTALDTAGSGLETIGAIPVVGDGPERLGREVRAAAEEVRVSAFESRQSVRSLSVVIALVVGVLPTVPPLLLYLPWRAGRRREVEAIAAALRDRSEDTDLEEHLARRAVERLPFDALVAITPTPWRDLEEGRFRLLANAELTRLGLARRGGVAADRRSATSGDGSTGSGA